MINAIISVIFELNISLFSSINDESNKKVTRVIYFFIFELLKI